MFFSGSMKKAKAEFADLRAQVETKS
jgi:hypothetical protein